MKRFDALITMQKNLSSLRSHVSEKHQEKPQKIGTFEEWSFWAMIFIFWVIMGFYNFSDPW